MSTTETAPKIGDREAPPAVLYADVIGDGWKRDDLPWRPWVENGRDGVEMVPLFMGDDAAALLLRFQPGAHGDFHTHGGAELMLVLDGVLEDDMGGYYPPGSLVVEATGTVHQALSRGGCTLLAVRERPAQPFEDQPGDKFVRQPAS
jgi:anti-sigma factor ChrR (cupin superfamily)